MSSSQLVVLYENGMVPCRVDYQGTRLRLCWKGELGAEGFLE